MNIICYRFHFLTIITFFISNILNAQVENFAWAVGKEGSTINEISTVDHAGNIIVSGRFYNSVDFDPGPNKFILTAAGISTDCFIQKLNSNGELIWAKSLGGENILEFRAVATDNENNILITGTCEGTIDFDPGNGVFNLTSHTNLDIFILKLDKNGDFLWAKIIGNNSLDSGTQIMADETGNVYVGGYFQNTVDFDPGSGTHNLSPAEGQSFFILKLDKDANFIWAKRMPGELYKRIKMTLDKASNIYFLSNFSGPILTSGSETLVSNGKQDIFLEKLDASGNFIWTKQFGGLYDENSADVKIDGSGNIYVTGTFQATWDADPGAGINNLISNGGKDFFIMKLNNSGQFITARSFGGIQDDFISSIGFDEFENLYVTGAFKGQIYLDLEVGPGKKLSSNGEYDPFMLKLDTLLNLHSGFSFGGSGKEEGLYIHAYNAENIYLHVQYSSGVQFETLAGNYFLSDASGFILKLGKDHGVDYRDNFTISSYPNPTNGFIYIEQKSLSQTAIINSEIDISIIDYLGKIIFKLKTSDQLSKIDLSEYLPGIYIITVKYRDNEYITKVFKI